MLSSVDSAHLPAMVPWGQAQLARESLVPRALIIAPLPHHRGVSRTAGSHRFNQPARRVLSQQQQPPAARGAWRTCPRLGNVRVASPRLCAVHHWA